jgi:hypothetical protein
MMTWNVAVSESCGLKLIDDGFAEFIGGLPRAAPEQIPTAHGQVDGVRILGANAFFAFAIPQGPAQSAHQTRHNLILQLEQVGHVLLEAVGPQVRAGFGVDKLRIDAHSVLIALH